MTLEIHEQLQSKLTHLGVNTGDIVIKMIESGFSFPQAHQIVTSVMDGHVQVAAHFTLAILELAEKKDNDVP